MSRKSWIIFIVFILALLVGLVVWSKNNSTNIDVSSVDPNAVQIASDISGNIADHVYGKIDSNVVIIEYSDYQCPACGDAYPKVKQLLEKYSDKVMFIYRNFPLTSIHPNARAAAAAAEAAGLQGKYWEMHDKLFENQSGWSSATIDERTNKFKSYATSIGIDPDQFTKDIALKSIISKIDFDISLGEKSNVKGTPNFKLNGETVNLNDLESTIKSKL